jgi:hypothetical protein
MGGSEDIVKSLRNFYKNGIALTEGSASSSNWFLSHQVTGNSMRKTDEEFEKADARAFALRKQIHEIQAELYQINGSSPMGERRACLESHIRRLRIEAARAYAPVIAALEDDQDRAAPIDP